MQFSTSLHDLPPEQDYFGWHTDPNDWTRGSVTMVRGHITGYQKDQKGRTRWKGESRDGAAYEEVELLSPAGLVTAPKAGENVEGVFISINGDHSQVLFFPTGDSEKRQKLDEGWFGIADPQDPTRHIQIDPDGNITINEPTGNVTVKGAKDVTIEGAENVNVKSANVSLEGTAGVTIKATTLTVEADIQHTGNMTTSGTHTASLGTH